MRVRLILPAAVSMIGGLALLSYGYVAQDAWWRRADALASLQAMPAFTLLLRAGDAESAERRGLYLALIQADPPAEPLQAARERTDGALQAAAAAMARLSIAPLARQVDAVQAALAVPRQAALVALAKPLAERSRDSALSVISGFSEINGRLDTAIAASQLLAGRNDATLGYLREHPPSTAVLTAADWRGAQAA